MADNSSATVLVVDDETALAESYAAMIGTKHDTRVATSGSEALEVVDDDVDVVLLDRRMPDYSGLEVLEAIHDRGLDPQVVICSAVDPDLETLDYEFDTYLRKPASSDELLEVVDRQHRLSDCDPEAQEYFALEAKRATIEDARPLSALQGDERYERLLRKLDQKSDAAHASGDNPIRAD